MIRIIFPKHYRSNSLEFYATKLHQIKTVYKLRVKTWGNRRVASSLKMILKSLTKTNGTALLFFSLDSVEQLFWLVVLLVGLGFFFSFFSFGRKVADKLEGEIYCDLMLHLSNVTNCCLVLLTNQKRSLRKQ